MKKTTNVLKNRIGEKLITNQGYEIEIIEYFSNKNITVVIHDNYKTIIKNRNYSDLKRGKLNNPYHKSICNKGFIGEGEYKVYADGKKTKAYDSWKSMFNRAYSEKSQERLPTYKEVTVCEEWHNFQNFAKWHEENYNPETMQGWHIDKDILVKGNKIYSPETCAIVPSDINYLFTKSNTKRGDLPIGVNRYLKKYRAQFRKNNKTIYLGVFDTPEEAFQAYKVAKEGSIAEFAEEWREIINPKVYQALYNYQVEITD